MKKKALVILIVFMILSFLPLLSACNENVTDHVIEVYSSSIQQGRVSGDGVYKTGEQVTLIAQESTGTFVAWIKSSMLVSTEKEYSFTANSTNEGKYTAIFNGTPTFYYQPSGVAVEYKNLSDGFITITGITLKLTLLNTNNIQTVYDNSSLNIEVTSTYQNSETLQIESSYYLSKLKTYYLDLQVRYTTGTQSGVINKTILVNFTNLTFEEDDQNNTFAKTTISAKNSNLQTTVAVSFHPAGSTIPENIILWD